LLTNLHMFWSQLEAPVKAAALGAAVTVLSTTFGALLVFWQIGRQSKNAIRQNQHTERLKLKLRIYEDDILQKIKAAMSAEIALTNYLRAFHLGINMFKIQSKCNMKGSIPKARIPELNEYKYDAIIKAIDLIMFIEEWLIIDGRMDVFKMAFNVTIHDIDKAFGPYLKAALLIYPMEHAENPAVTLQPASLTRRSASGSLTG